MERRRPERQTGATIAGADTADEGGTLRVSEREMRRAKIGADRAEIGGGSSALPFSLPSKGDCPPHLYGYQSPAYRSETYSTHANSIAASSNIS